MNRIAITSWNSLSALGSTEEEIWKNYQNDLPFFNKSGDDLVASISSKYNKELESLKQENKNYTSVDRSVLMAIFTAREAIKKSQWNDASLVGINIGSSRGATTLFEKHFFDFTNQGKANLLSSPTTTLGNISSWVANDLKSTGISFSHSITCSTSFHALLNGMAWIQSGMSHQFLIGGSEAPLTPFTIAQMKALKIYAVKNDEPYPNKAMDASLQSNSMILGEGAASICIENENKATKAHAFIDGRGFSTEVLTHGTSISSNALCLQKSMKMALNKIHPSDIDVVITHSPGTIKGDKAERQAIEKIFGVHKPAISNNKWKLGHTLGSSALLSLELGLLMLKHQTFIPIPYIENKTPDKLQKIMINSVGFGGNAVSIIISKD